MFVLIWAKRVESCQNWQSSKSWFTTTDRASVQAISVEDVRSWISERELLEVLIESGRHCWLFLREMYEFSSSKWEEAVSYSIVMVDWVPET